jgi:hypothetical protein
MDDLISRHMAIDQTMGKLDYTDVVFDTATESEIVYMLRSLPSIPAVPLDKLCVWLSKFGSPCEINEGMCEMAHGYDRCVGIFHSSAFCWQYWLTKMMEEQDAAD